MYLRKYHPSDCAALAALFYETVHTVNAKDYSPEQLDAWADGQVDLNAWNESFLAHNTYVAVQECDGADDIDNCASDSVGPAPRKTDGSLSPTLIIGFGDMDDTGYLDRLYVYKNYQGKGVATAICNRLEEDFRLSRESFLQNSAAQKNVIPDNYVQKENASEKIKNDTFTTHASITARPFFEKRGYAVVKAQQVVRKGIFIRNYIMRKRIV